MRTELFGTRRLIISVQDFDVDLFRNLSRSLGNRGIQKLGDIGCQRQCQSGSCFEIVREFSLLGVCRERCKSCTSLARHKPFLAFY